MVSKWEEFTSLKLMKKKYTEISLRLCLVCNCVLNNEWKQKKKNVQPKLNV